MTGIATVEQRREILQKLRSEKKYRKPWESGDLAAISFLGGDWNDYAQIVFSMATLDTLLNIEEKLSAIAEGMSSTSTPAGQRFG
jgi:hypothetical protein